MELTWEELKDNHSSTIWRAKVFGGWLVKCVDDASFDGPGRLGKFGVEWRSSITFMPDPDHQWGIVKKEATLPFIGDFKSDFVILWFHSPNKPIISNDDFETLVLNTISRTELHEFILMNQKERYRVVELNLSADLKETHHPKVYHVLMVRQKSV